MLLPQHEGQLPGKRRGVAFGVRTQPPPGLPDPRPWRECARASVVCERSGSHGALEREVVTGACEHGSHVPEAVLGGPRRGGVGAVCPR